MLQFMQIHDKHKAHTSEKKKNLIFVLQQLQNRQCFIYTVLSKTIQQMLFQLRFTI